MNAFPAIVARLTPEDYGSCGPAVPHLCKLLRDRRFDVQGAALTALELVGDGRAVTHVEGLSQWLKEPDARQRLGTERVQAMEAAIERALPILKDRQTRERDVSRLLRPAYKPGEDAETLLRPAEPGIGDDARLLVRPADGEGDP
jgi:hypothetical protein